ncbi:hypothetical protein KP509_1Z316000 [Ceratopteris richardii]|nr:hypothetical protein KP509_1Z316000 [Ceratopteris richardii]
MKGSRRHQRLGATVAANAASAAASPSDPRVIIPSVSAAAHCAQSCLRFWNLLLQDAASVNPFGLSTDNTDRAGCEYGEDSHPSALDTHKDSDTLSFPSHPDEEDCVENQQGNDDEDKKLASCTNGCPVPRPESYMKPRTIHWWNHFVGFAREDDTHFCEIFRLPVGFLTTVCDLCREDMRQGDIPPSLRHVEGRIMSVERQVAIAVMRLSTGNNKFRV